MVICSYGAISLVPPEPQQIMKQDMARCRHMDMCTCAHIPSKPTASVCAGSFFSFFLHHRHQLG